MDLTRPALSIASSIPSLPLYPVKILIFNCKHMLHTYNFRVSCLYGININQYSGTHKSTTTLTRLLCTINSHISS